MVAMSSGPFRLDGRVAFVTGAGGGLGEGICASLAAAGAAVACVDIDADRAERIARRLAEEGGRSVALHVDVSDAAALEAAVQNTVREFGGIDVLVNNAAIYPRRAWTEITEQEWDRVFAVNLKAYFLAARACHPSMKERGRGHIVNISSTTFLIGFEMLLDYVASKGGIIGFTRALAHEVGRDGITVNAIAPGAFPTDAEKIHPDPAGYNQWVLDQQCIQRRGTPEDVGNLVVFLSSDASSFITGQTVAIDGGWAMH
jgi:3-oxoacyl-[acyl-carrier protein] reductase